MGDDIIENSIYNNSSTGGMVFVSSISLSSDGTVLAVGAENYFSDTNSAAGLVKIYKWSGSSWVQRGADIIGDSSEGIGQSVSLSSDGNILVMGADSQIGSDDKTHVKIYFWNGISWVLQADIAPDQGTKEVSVSGDGKYIAIGSWGYGKVYTYGWDGSSWLQRGSTIQPSIDYFGYSVELNSDGSVLVVGSWTDKVYVYNWNGSEWVLRGDPIIEGELPEAYSNGFNKKVSINADGSVIATYNNIATPQGNSGGTTIQVYKWDGVKWKKIGENTSITATGDRGGLALSDDGLTFVVGEPEYLNSDGRARVLKTTLLDNVGDTDSDSAVL